MTKINKVTRMADLPDDLAANVRNWPHYAATSETHPEDAYESMGSMWDPLVSENGERGEWRLTGYAEAGTTTDDHRLWILRMNRSTFTYGYMTPGSTSLTVGSVNEAGTKASIEAWITEQLTLDLEPARVAGTIAYNVGRPVKWQEYGAWGMSHVTDPHMAEVVDRRWGLARHRLGTAFRDAWEANAAHDRARDAALHPTPRPAARLDKRQARRARRRAA